MPGKLSYTNSIVVVMPAKDFQKSCDWYRDVLGLEMLYAIEEVPWAEFATDVPNFTIGISPNAEGAGTTGEAITFGVEDIDSHRAELESRGVQFTGPTEGIPDMVMLAPFVDLDGNPLLLAQNLMPAGA